MPQASQHSMFMLPLLVLLGYTLGCLHVPFSWLLILIVTIYYLYSKFFISEFRLPFHEQNIRRQNRRQFLPNSVLLPLPTNKTNDKNDKQQSNLAVMKSNQSNGIACVNAIVETLWKGLQSEHIQDKLNIFLQTTKPISNVMVNEIFFKINFNG